MTDQETLEILLARAFDRRFSSGHQVENLVRLSAGASREAYSFELHQPDGAIRSLILKRDPPDAPVNPDDNRFGADRQTEAAILAAAFQAGVPVPQLLLQPDSDDGIGDGFVMQALAGETLPQKILRDPELAHARQGLPAQLGSALARLHAVPVSDAPAMRRFTLDDHLAAFRRVLQGYGQPQPGFEFGLRWLDRNRPVTEQPVFAHGDYRLGNVMIGPDGLVGILDWEVGHIGDRYIDIAWPSVRAWRFGQDRNPFAGLGQRQDFINAYHEAGGRQVDLEVVRYWEVLGTLRWGIMCMTIGQQFTTGRERSVEKAVIGRRVAETELDFLMLIEA